MSKKQITTTTVLVTPTMCTRWLNENINNRPLHNRHVAILARSMVRGDWKFNGESLKFDKSGNVLDGQHRMWACIESGISFRTLVIVNLPRETFNTIDTGIIRTPTDILSINGIVNVKTVVAALKHIGRYTTHTMMNMMKFTNQEVEELLKQHPEIVDYSKQTRKKLNVVRWCTGSIVCTCWYLASRIHKEKADIFFESFLRGTNIPIDSPILVLRNKLIDVKSTHMQRLSATHKIQLIVMTWNLWRKGKTVKHFKLATLNTSSMDFPDFK